MKIACTHKPIQGWEWFCPKHSQPYTHSVWCYPSFYERLKKDGKTLIKYLKFETEFVKLYDKHGPQATKMFSEKYS